MEHCQIKSLYCPITLRNNGIMSLNNEILIVNKIEKFVDLINSSKGVSIGQAAVHTVSTIEEADAMSLPGRCPEVGRDRCTGKKSRW